MNIISQDFPNEHRSERLLLMVQDCQRQSYHPMAEENREIGQHDIKIMTSTIEQVKKFLDNELAKYETWKHVNKFIKVIFSSNSQFQQCKKDGVGQSNAPVVIR